MRKSGYPNFKSEKIDSIKANILGNKDANRRLELRRRLANLYYLNNPSDLPSRGKSESLVATNRKLVKAGLNHKKSPVKYYDKFNKSVAKVDPKFNSILGKQIGSVTAVLSSGASAAATAVNPALAPLNAVPYTAIGPSVGYSIDKLRMRKLNQNPNIKKNYNLQLKEAAHYAKLEKKVNLMDRKINGNFIEKIIKKNKSKRR